MVAKKFVLVLLVMMLLPPPKYVEKKFEDEALPIRAVVMVPDALLKFCSVDEPETKSAVPVALVKLSCVAVSAPMSARVEKRSVEEACVVVLFPIERNWKVEDAVLMRPPWLKVWSAVQIGVMDWESAGEASLLMKVKALPLFAVRPMVAVGFAPTAEAVRQVEPSIEKQVERTPPAKVEVPPETVRLPPMFMNEVVAFVPIPLVKLSVGKVARREYRSVEEAAVKSAFVPVNVEAKRLVLVAFVEVLFVMESDCSVLDASAMSPPQKEETPDVAVIWSVVMPPNTSSMEDEVVPTRPIAT